MRVLVLGIGQTMRGDDAAGVEAVRRWQARYAATAARPDVNVQFDELPGLSLLDILDGADAAVLVDAVQSGSAPGTVHRLKPEDLASFEAGSKSAHGWGVAETLRLGRQLDPARAGLRVSLIGIEAEQVELGKPLSPSVEQALPGAVDAIEAAVQASLAEPGVHLP